MAAVNPAEEDLNACFTRKKAAEAAETASGRRLC